MAVSTGVRHAITEAGSWLVAAAILVGGVVYYEELKGPFAAIFGGGLVQQRAADAPAADSSPQQRELPGSRVEIDADRHGHYRATAEINGRDVRVLVDTGATLVALGDETARDLGIYLSKKDYTRRARTANGIAMVAPVTLERVTIGGITVRNVQALVHEPGALATEALLGMSFLGKLQRVGISGGRLVLEE